MASPEQIGEWLNEELNIERPVGEGRTGGVQLNDLVPEQHAERAMGDIEEIQQFLHEHGMWILSRTLLVSCSREPTEAEVRRALAEIIKWNPAFRVSVNKSEDPSKRWELVKQLDVQPRLLHVTQARDWREVAQEQMLAPIEDKSAPQFRCHYLSKVKGPDGAVQKGRCAFVFTLNHALIDGMSSIGLLKKFCSVLNSIMKGKPYIIVPWTKMFPPVDIYCECAFEDLASEEGGKEIQESLKSHPKVNVPAFLAHNNLYIETCGAESDNKSDMKKMTCLIFRDLSAEQTETLRKECRKHGATIQGAAQVAGAIALASLLPSSDKDRKITYNYALNQRPHIAKEVPVDYAGFYIALALMNSVTIGPNAQNDVPEFWRLATESTAQIKDMIKRKHILVSWWAFKDQAQSVKQIKVEDLPRTKESRMEMLYTTTYGVWDFPIEADDIVKMEGVFSGSSIHEAGPVINQQLVTVNGKLHWTIAFSQRVISPETAEKYADTVLGILSKAVE